MFDKELLTSIAGIPRGNNFCFYVVQRDTVILCVVFEKCVYTI